MKKLLLTLAFWFAVVSSALAAVNINTASKEELMSLKGIGEKRADDIIEYRKKNGDFKSVDDLEKVKGIGPATIKQIRKDLAVTGRTAIDNPASKSPTGSKGKGAQAKATTPAKGDAMKADKAIARVAEKAKAKEKVNLATKEKSAEQLGLKEIKKATNNKSDAKADKKPSKN